jgi:hypothetical protein
MACEQGEPYLLNGAQGIMITVLMLRILVLVLIITVQPSIYICDSFFDPLKANMLKILVTWHVDTEYIPTFCSLKMIVVPTFFSVHSMRCIVLFIVLFQVALQSMFFFLGGGGGQWKHLRVTVQLQ